MINSFRHKGLRDLLLEGQTRGVQQSQVLHAAVVLSDMDRPGLNLHPLKGDLQGYWAVKVDGNDRVIFRFADGKAEDVDLRLSPCQSFRLYAGKLAQPANHL